VFLAELDVRNKLDVQAFYDALPEDWKAIDVLVNNAGLAKGLSKFYDGDTDHWDQMIDTNIKGLLYVSRTLTPGMISRRKGHIINIGSIAGKEVYDNGNVYCGTKFAVDAITKSMRLELAVDDVKVTGIHPGPVAAGRTRGEVPGEAAGCHRRGAGIGHHDAARPALRPLAVVDGVDAALRVLGVLK
jgi:NADP-dependent 3-hydroxy acid dehydrogenase YdfG